MAGTAVKERRWLPAPRGWGCAAAVQTASGEQKCLKVIKVRGSPEGPAAPAAGVAGGSSERKGRGQRGTRALGAGENPWLALRLLKKSEVAEEKEGEG